MNGRAHLRSKSSIASSCRCVRSSHVFSEWGTPCHLTSSQRVLPAKMREVSTDSMRWSPSPSDASSSKSFSHSPRSSSSVFGAHASSVFGAVASSAAPSPAPSPAPPPPGTAVAGLGGSGLAAGFRRLRAADASAGLDGPSPSM